MYGGVPPETIATAGNRVVTFVGTPKLLKPVRVTGLTVTDKAVEPDRPT